MAVTAAQARRERAQLMKEIRREHVRADRARLVSLRQRFRDARAARGAAIRSARGACRLRGKVPTVAEARRMLAAARAEAKRACRVDLEGAARLRDDAARARAELEAERKHQRALKRIERGNVARAKESKRTRARERQAESDDEVRGNIPPELVYLFERVKRQIKGSPHMSRTEQFLKYAEEHPDEELAALEDKTDALIRELEARERGETMRRNPKTLSAKASKRRFQTLKKAGCKPKRVRLPDGSSAVLRTRPCNVKPLKNPAACAQEKKIARLRSRVRTLEAKVKARRNPRRPPRAWWQACLSSVSAQHHAHDPAAVCGASWWRMPPKERAAIVRQMERAGPKQRRRAIAIAKAERNRAARGARKASGKKKKKKPREPRRKNPLVELHSVTYVEQKEGDRKPHLYEHEFDRPRPRLRKTDGRPLKIVRGASRTNVRGGWIHD